LATPLFFWDFAYQQPKIRLPSPIPLTYQDAATRSTSNRRARRPCARVVQSAKEKEAAAKQASTSAQKQARKKAEAPEAFQAPIQSSAIELSDDDDDDETFFDVDVDADTDTPAGPTNSAPAPVANSAPVKSTARKVRKELGFQLYAYVGTTEVYQNTGQIVMALFDFSAENLAADDAARKFARQMGGQLGERTTKGTISWGGKQPPFSKRLDNIDDWKALDKLGLSVLSGTTSKMVRLDWEMRWPLELPAPAPAPAPVNDDDDPLAGQPLPRAAEDDNPVCTQPGLRVRPF